MQFILFQERLLNGLPHFLKALYWKYYAFYRLFFYNTYLRRCLQVSLLALEDVQATLLQ